ncbi:MAG: aminoacyl-tRNA hydrolase [Candidatus Marinimicrobia bacterium]|nr:aminoacyl-tRNA hydrolase [Candidatus Neomarinimicrobiota bacterium]
MLIISDKISIPIDEIEFHAIRSQGSGGQHVNKVSTAIQLRFDINASSLPVYIKNRLLKLNDSRITIDGVIVIKSQESRSQKKNKDVALYRLSKIITNVLVTPKKRIPTKPTKSSKVKRLDSKTKHSRKKAIRKKIDIKKIDQ